MIVFLGGAQGDIVCLEKSEVRISKGEGEGDGKREMSNIRVRESKK